ncbi:cytochrome d ubiquinol oxidase subunit II, partial [Acuticoccus kandeliae]
VAGGATFAAFPEWYASLFSGFYLAFLLLLVALILRGIALEYRAKEPRWAPVLDRVLTGSSLAAALLLGVALANIVHGVPLDADHEFTGTLLTLLHPYALLGGVTTV